MLIKTSVLELSHTFSNYRLGNRSYVCLDFVEKFFVKVPNKIMLHISTRKSKDAVEVMLDQDNYGDLLYGIKRGIGMLLKECTTLWLIP